MTTTGGLSEKDKVVVKLPFGWQFSRDSEVIGLTSTLKNVMDDVTISVDQRQIDIIMQLSENFSPRRFLSDEGSSERRDLQISSGLSFEFRIT